MTTADPTIAGFSRIATLAPDLADEEARHIYLSLQLKAFLANQIRSLRGDRSQEEFGHILGKPQSVVSRLENESYGKVTVQTLLDIARKLDIALVMRFVDFPTFLKWTGDYSPTALAPQKFDAPAIDRLANEEAAPRDHGAAEAFLTALQQPQRADVGAALLAAARTSPDQPVQSGPASGREELAPAQAEHAIAMQKLAA